MGFRSSGKRTFCINIFISILTILACVFLPQYFKRASIIDLWVGMTVPWCTCRGQRITRRSQRSPFTLWVPGIEHRSSGLATDVFTCWVFSSVQNRSMRMLDDNFYFVCHCWRIIYTECFAELSYSIYELSSCMSIGLCFGGAAWICVRRWGKQTLMRSLL